MLPIEEKKKSNTIDPKSNNRSCCLHLTVVMGVEIIESRKEDFEFLDFRKKKKKTITGIIYPFTFTGLPIGSKSGFSALLKEINTIIINIKVLLFSYQWGFWGVII